MDPYDAPERLRMLPSWLLAQASTRAAGLVADRLAGAGAHRRHYAMLTALAESGPVSQADLGRLVGLDRSDVTAAVTELERAGQLRREQDPANRRRNLVRLTRAGDRRRGELDDLVQQVQDELLADLTTTERRTLVRLLTKTLG